MADKKTTEMAKTTETMPEVDTTVKTAKTTETTPEVDTTATAEPKKEYVPVQFRSAFKNIVYGMGNGEHIVFSGGYANAKTEAEYNFLVNHIDFKRSLFIVK